MWFRSLFSKPTERKDEVGWDEVEWNGVEWFHSIPPGPKTEHIPTHGGICNRQAEERRKPPA